MLGVEESLAARLLQERGLSGSAVREKVATFEHGFKEAADPIVISSRMDVRGERAKATLQSFLAGLKSLKSEDLIDFFAEQAHLTDASGARWNREGFLRIVKCYSPLTPRRMLRLLSKLRLPKRMGAESS
jgi:hypothetical protein